MSQPEPTDDDGGTDGPTIDLTNEVDANWLNEDPPDPAYANADEDEIAELWDEHRQRRAEKSLSKAALDYAAVDDALFDAYEKSVWWELGADDDSLDLQKAPGIWRHDDEVPEMVRELIAEIIRTTDWDWADFESLTRQEADDLVDLLEEKLTQPQGWSVGSLAEDIEDRFDLAQDAALGVARDASHNVLSTTREEAYEQMEGSEEFEYDWINPDDHRTTEVCKEIMSRVEAAGGSAPLPRLKQFLREAAMKYAGTREGGTPDRVEYWEPHYQCRSAFVRRVQAF